MEPLSLEKLCLSSIVNNFNIFNYAYSTSEDAPLLRNLQFLQKRYSTYLIENLSETKNLKSEYVKFLVNKYLKEFDFYKFLSLTCWEELTERVVEIAEGLLKVKFGARMFKEHRKKVQEIIERLQNVECLCLYIPFEYDGIMEYISKCCPYLKELDLQHNDYISDKSLRTLCSVGFPSLRVLRLDNVKIRDETIIFILKNMPFLEVFNTPYLTRALYCFHKKDLAENKLHAVQKYSLTELAVHYAGREQEKCLSILTVLCPEIKKLYCPVDNKVSIDLCSKFLKLEELELISIHDRNSKKLLSSSGVNPYQLNPMKLNKFLKIRGKNLTSLFIHGLAVSTSLLIQNCQKLEKLNLSEIDFHYEKNSCVPPLKYLKLLRISTDTDSSYIISPTAAESLSLILDSSPNIERLYINCLKILSDFQLRNTILKHCELNTLKYLDFSWSDVDVNFSALILKSCLSLQKMEVTLSNGKGVSSEEFEILAQIASDTKNSPKIQWYDIDKNILKQSWIM
ncbi:uncharacterized protein LOC118179711 [Stegodyphus dumicola]|uniref:uncharacterized protein LOC118179711 n=1 Tax=Stegodyphus dumicola TaxID=202533 RepID=UPI0015ADB41A|nr:uncharacterized protein LOC118179711 [Stegodyphus dumicola]